MTVKLVESVCGISLWGVLVQHDFDAGNLAKHPGLLPSFGSEKDGAVLRVPCGSSGWGAQFIGKFIADSPHGKDVFGFGGIVFNLAA